MGLLVGWREKREVILGGIYLLRGVGLVFFVCEVSVGGYHLCRRQM